MLFCVGLLFWSRDDPRARKVRQPIVRQVRRIQNQLRRKGSSHRIAVVIPFVGTGPESIPTYLPLFCSAAAGSASLVDFLLIHNGALDQYHHPVPQNVHLISLESTFNMAEKLTRVVDRRGDDLVVDNMGFLTQVIDKHIERYPYALVEFKPALGHVFAEFLAGYTHWAYSDLDIAFGDLPRWITDEELRDFDVVTYGFGDQDRVYLRGQFTIHKNTAKVNQLWRDCEYLSKADIRFMDVLTEKTKLHFESAEGCYSTVVVRRDDIRVKYAVKAASDVKETDTVYQHGAFLGVGTKRDRSVIYKAATSDSGKTLMDLSPTWFESTDSAYGSHNSTVLLQREVGERTEIQLDDNPEANCMYWIQKKYQSTLCLSDVSSSDTVFLIDGKLYKQPYELSGIPDGVVTAPFFHFQEWKRYYRATQLSALDRTEDSLTYVILKEGIIPVVPSTATSPSEHGSNRVAPVSRDKKAPSPLGLPPHKWRASQHFQARNLPSNSYCVRPERRKFPPVPAAAGCGASVSWLDPETTEILHVPTSWNQINVEEDVTLALTLQITAEQAVDRHAIVNLMDIAEINTQVWEGQPCVVVVHLLGATDAVVSTVRQHFTYLDNEACLVGFVAEMRDGYVSRKALTNMASDAAPTRWVVTGVEVERGMILSQESVLFAHRQAEINKHHPGQVFVVPQFAVRDDGSLHNDPIPVVDLLKMKKQSTPEIRDPSDFEVGSCEDDQESGNKLFQSLNDLWWMLTAIEVSGTVHDNDDLLANEVSEVLEQVEATLSRLLSSEEHLTLFSADLSPILMVDNMGPHPGLRTSDLVREVEEFVGKLCYNVLRLAQLAAYGYYINTLPGAFATSTHASRHSTLGHMNEDAFGASRCDGCILFTGEDEKILEQISKEEQYRPAMAAILWTQLAREGKE